MLRSSNLELLLLTPRAPNAEKNQITSAFRKFWVGSIWNYECFPLGLNTLKQLFTLDCPGVNKALYIATYRCLHSACSQCQV